MGAFSVTVKRSFKTVITTRYLTDTHQSALHDIPWARWKPKDEASHGPPNQRVVVKQRHCTHTCPISLLIKVFVRWTPVGMRKVNLADANSILHERLKGDLCYLKFGISKFLFLLRKLLLNALPPLSTRKTSHRNEFKHMKVKFEKKIRLEFNFKLYCWS